MAVLCNATISGPYPMNYQLPIPEGEGKVVVYSNPMLNGGKIFLTNTSTNEVVQINASVTYQPVWYYILSQGEWVVTAIATNYDVTIDGVWVSVDDTVVIDDITTIIFYPTE